MEASIIIRGRRYNSHPYKGYIIYKNQNGAFQIKDFTGLYVTSVDVAKKCIDVYLMNSKPEQLGISTKN